MSGAPLGLKVPSPRPLDLQKARVVAKEYVVRVVVKERHLQPPPPSAAPQPRPLCTWGRSGRSVGPVVALGRRAVGGGRRVARTFGRGVKRLDGRTRAHDHQME